MRSGVVAAIPSCFTKDTCMPASALVLEPCSTHLERARRHPIGFCQLGLTVSSTEETDGTVYLGPASSDYSYCNVLALLCQEH